MKDALDRRSRFAKPQPVDTNLVLTERDYMIFEALDRHGKLPTNYLYEFIKDKYRNYADLQRRLTQLYNGYCNSPSHPNHQCRGESYVARDWQQMNNFQARYQPAIYGITPTSKRLLYSLGRAAAYTPERNDPFVHQFFGGCFSASFERRATPHRFIGREEILTHAKCPPTTRDAPNPFAIPVADRDIRSIVPDNLIGLEYEDGGFRFFAVEIDRNTESISPKKPVRNSIAKKVKGYSDILTTKAFTTHFGLPNLTVLFVTTNVVHLQRMIAHVREAVDPRYQQKFLFKAFPTFGEVWRVPRELLPVFEPWSSAAGDADISKKAQ